MGLIFQTVINSAILSVFYTLMALGLTLVFGVMGILNFAHGELYMIGAYSVWILYAQGPVPFPVAVLIAIVIVAGVSIVMQKGIFQPTRDRPMMGLIMSIGLLFIIQVIVAQTWGVALMRHVPPYMRGSLDILGATVSSQRLVLVPVASSLLGGLWYFLTRTKTGQALRASAQDPETASLQGIDRNRSGIIAMGIGGILAGAAGALLSPIVLVTPYMGHVVIITALLVTVVGGVGNIVGAVVASFIYGFLHTFITTYVDSTLATIAGVLLMFIVLVVRPRGIIGRV
ncbi:High-affinity branched-chain amino acid transport system permease protein LivH [subsurface metagenome]